jgi:hypothetical protein
MSPPAPRIRFTAPLSLVLLALAALVWATHASAVAPTCGSSLLFAAPTVLPMPAKPSRIALADLNNDGILDMIVPTPDASSGVETTTISVMLGEGGGTFAPPVAYTVGTRPFEAVAGDFDGDGKLDLAVTNWLSDNVAILHGMGDGTFGAPNFFPCGRNPQGLVAGDFNHDGILDLAVANNGSASVSMLRGLGGGTFGLTGAYPLADLSLGISVADLDGDGNLDLVATAYHHGIAVLMGHGDGLFSPARSYAAGPEPDQITIRDLDGDGIPDLVVSNSSSGGVAIVKGLGGGTFGTPAIYGAGSINGASTVVADFNGDGIQDFAVSNALDGIQPGLVQVFSGLPDGSFSLLSSYTVSPYCLGLATSDLNGDGRPDVMVAGYGTSVVDILFGHCPGCNLPLVFAPPVVEPLPAKPNRLTLVDLNRDGVLDLVATTPDGSSGGYTDMISVMLGVSGGAFAPPVSYAVGSRPMEAVAGDFDGDGKLDLAVTDWGSDNVAILPGNGDGTFGAASFFPCGSNPHGLVVADLNRDGILDLAVANNGANSVSVLMGLGTFRRGNGTFAAPIAYPLVGVSLGISVEDLDADGNLDLVATAGASGIAVLKGRGDGTFAPARVYAAGPQPVQITIRDLNADRLPDLLVSNRSFGGVAYLRALGGGTFAGPTMYGAGLIDAAQTVIADFNGDGIPDFAVTDADPNHGLVEVYGGLSTVGVPNGTFSLHSSYAVSNSCLGLATTDLNADGQPDLVVAGYGTSALDVMLGGCLDQPVPTVASLASAEAAADRIRLTWYSAGNAGLAATVYRRTAATDWVAMGRISADGTGYLRYEDTSVQPGTRYGYRLGIMDAGAPVYVAEAWVTAEAPAFMLEGARPNPASGNALKVDFALPSAEPARLELFDVGGRRVAAREVGSLGAGWHTVDLAAGKRIPAGIYVIRFSQRGAAKTAHVTVLN